MQVQLEKTAVRHDADDSRRTAPLSPRWTRTFMLTLSLIDDKILVAPVRKSKYNIDELLAGITDENIHPEVDFGPLVGKEML